MAYAEDDLLPLSALQHLAFCERQCALIYLEDAWVENRLTMEGRQLHERTHAADVEVRGDLRIVRGLRLQSLRLGVSGQADVVEFHRCTAANGAEPAGVELPEVDGRWQPYPVEYKRGRPKADPCDEVQLCAQAMCLEEMLGAALAEGALYYGQPHRRHKVQFLDYLREATDRLAFRLHEMVASGVTPPAAYEKKCKSCSMLDVCLPESAGAGRSVQRYFTKALTDALGEVSDTDETDA